MREEKITADRLAAFSDAVFAVIVTIMVLELRAPDRADILGSLASVAHGHQLCGELPVHRHYLDKPPLPYAVRRSSDAGIDMDQLRPSLHGVALALCDRMDCAHPARVVPCSVLRRAVRVHRHCLQRLRARSIGPRGRHAGVRAYAANGEAPITRCPCEFHDRDAGCVRRAAPRLRSDMRRPDPPLAARCLWQSPMTVLESEIESAVRLYKSMTTSRIGCEQQTRRLPSAHHVVDATPSQH